MLRPRMLFLTASLLVAMSGPVPADGPIAGSGTLGPEATRGLSVQADPRAKETLYRPAYDTWTLYDLRIYPILRRAADGTRSLLLYVSTQGDRRIGTKSLDLDIDGSSVTVALKRSDVKADTNGCRVLEDVLLEGQDELVRRLAAAREASVSVVGVLSTHRYQLSEEEIANFARIVALYGAESLPEPEKPKAPPEGGPDKKDLTNPQIIRSTRVNPEFPVMARDKMARGKVTLQAVVREDGSTDVIDVLKSSARYCGFEQAAIDAVRRWHYEPGRQDGKPVDVYFTIDIDFIWR
jgi:TonB family protein